MIALQVQPTPKTLSPLDWIRHLDVFTMLVLVAVIALSLRGVYLLVRGCDRASLRRFRIQSILPVLLGLAGTFTLTYFAEHTLVYGDFGQPLEIVAPAVFAEVRRPVFVGLAGTGLLLLIAIFGLFRAGSYQSDAANAALGAPHSSS